MPVRTFLRTELAWPLSSVAVAALSWADLQGCHQSSQHTGTPMIQHRKWAAPGHISFTAIERCTRRCCLFDEGHTSNVLLLPYTLVRELLAANLAWKTVTSIGG